MIAGAEATRSATRLLTQLVEHRNCHHWQLWIVQQWIYEFCYQLGMPLKFCNRRRILIGPKTTLLPRLGRAVYGKGSRASTALVSTRVSPGGGRTGAEPSRAEPAGLVRFVVAWNRNAGMS